MPGTPGQPRSPSIQSVFWLAWPLTLKAIMLNGTVVIDIYLVSGLGEHALSAMGLAAAIAGMLLGIILSFANATQIRFAQAFGAEDPVFLKSAFYSGLTISLAVCLAGLAGLLAAGGPVIDAFAPDPWIAGQTKRYLSVFAIVILCEAVGQCLSSYFNGCGDTKRPLYSYLLAVPVNVAFSVVFINGLFGLPAFGVMGAAMGSAIAALLQVAFLAHAFVRRTDGYRRVSGWRNGTFAASVRRHLAFSWPIAATFVSASLASNVCGLIYAKLSISDFAALTLIMPWVTMAGVVGMSWAQATGIVVAQLLGKGHTGAVMDAFLRRAFYAALVAAALVALFHLGIVLTAPWLYPDLLPETQATLQSFLLVLLVLPFPKGTNAICGNTLRAGGDQLYVMHIFIWSQWLFRVPATALMVLYFHSSATWVFALLLAEELVKFFPFHLRFLKGHWKTGDLSA